MEIRNTTVYTKNRLLGFNSFTVLRNVAMWIFFSVATALVTACYILQFFLFERSAAISFSFYFIIFFDAVYAFACFLLPIITIKKSKSNNITVNYIFGESTFFMSAQTVNGTEKAELPYANIIKALESKNDIYLYIGKNQAYIVDKSGFTEGTLDGFKGLIRAKVKNTRLI